MTIVSCTRIRNEEILLPDLLKHLLSFSEEVVVLDDASTDRSAEICKSFDRVHLLQNDAWAVDRLGAETSDRRRLTRFAAGRGHDWIVYMDADERLEGDVKGVLEAADSKVSAFRWGLFDAYFTHGQSQDYREGELAKLPRLFGPEERRIVMAWRSGGVWDFRGRDQREPLFGFGSQVKYSEVVRVKHYGKALTFDAWERKCQYYATNFPEPYASKWLARRGRQIHSVSQFGYRLGEWEEVVKRSVPHPEQVPLTLKGVVKSVLLAIRHAGAVEGVA